MTEESKSAHDTQFKARLNNNLPYQRAQNAVFATISRLDKQIAYSIATGGCQSLARTRQT